MSVIQVPVWLVITFVAITAALLIYGGITIFKHNKKEKENSQLNKNINEIERGKNK